MLPPSPSSSAQKQTSRRSKESRARPILSKICNKTKMCSFHLQGMCKRAGSCSFAHDPSEIQSKPNLSCTKMCPALINSGNCPQMHICKFAHSDAELRIIDVEGLDTLPVAIEASTPCSVDQQDQLRFDSSFQQPVFMTTARTCQLPRTAKPVVSLLNDAAMGGALTLGEMVFHLTRIFSAVYEARPEVADRVRVPADALATATAEETWIGAGLDKGSLLSFEEFACLCALPSELIPRIALSPALSAPTGAEASQPPVHKGKQAAYADDLTDFEAWSQRSTDDGSSDTSPSGLQTPKSCEGFEDVWCETEVKVVNTFIHVSTPSETTRTRRSRSVPSNLGRAA